MAYCYICKKHLAASFFYKDKTRSTGLSSRCKSCSKIYKSSWRATDGYRRSIKKYINSSRAFSSFARSITGIKKQKNISSKIKLYVDHVKLSTPCARCGTKGIGKMHLHHRDSSSKCFNFSGVNSVSFSKLLKELSKCDVLCASCHGELHYYEKKRA